MCVGALVGGMVGGSPLGGAVNSHGDEDPCTKIFGVLRKYHKVLTIHSRALFVEDTVPGNPIHLERRTPPRQPSWFDTHTHTQCL